jgi:AcrR family transcriptional regulator
VTAQRNTKAKSRVKDEIAEFKRKQILDAAVELFRENGYHGTSVDAIAGVLGVSKQFIYYQFKDKAAILDGVCTTGAQLTLSAITESDELAGSAEDKLRHFCRRLTEIVIDYGKYLAVYASEVASLRDDDRKRTLAIRAEVDKRVSELIERGRREGAFVAEDPLIAARAVTGMISFMWTWAHPEDPASRATLVKQVTQIALRALGVKE